MIIYAGLFTLHAAYFVLSKEPDELFIYINNFSFLGVAVCLGVGTMMSWRLRLRHKAAEQATTPS